MPLYEYHCGACGHRFEQIQKFSDPVVEICPNCGERKVQKLLSSPAFQFKGSGWYITDYARKGADGGTDTAKTAESKDGKDGKESKESKDSKAPSSDSSSTSTSSASSDTVKPAS